LRVQRLPEILIIGASGLAGSAALKHFAAKPGWKVTAVSRRRPLFCPDHVEHIPLDLLDGEKCAEIFAAMPGVTHIAYCAVNEQQGNMITGWRDPEQYAKNMAMLRNVVDPIVSTAHGFRHIGLVHGFKAYGSHLIERTPPMPYKESLPRIDQENFYHQHEDYIRVKQQGASWAWTIIRPGMIVGEAVGANMNTFLVLALFAALRKEAGLPLLVPDGASMITDIADADLLAQGLDWAAGAENARNEAFNLVNGDVFSLHDAFPIVAEELAMELAAPRPFDIAEEVRTLAHLWPGMVRKYGLKAPEDLDALLGESLAVGGGWTYPLDPAHVVRYGLSSTIKIRQAGFHDCMDTAEMFRKYTRRFQQLKIIPAVA
jgi:nucleoside-diphosphate-sugar epimerase